MSILQPEAGIFYGVCWVVVLVRLVSKRMRLGTWRNLQIDDYLIIVAMFTLTVLMALLHVIIHTNSNLIAPGTDEKLFTKEDIEERVYGSKLTIVVEQMHISTIWLLKACILIMYARMTELLNLRVLVLAAAVYVAVAYVLMEILWFGVWCKPFPQYWAVPTNSTQCSAMINHLITNATLNISSDVLIMLIPFPLVFKVKLPWTKKAILASMFTIGSFTIFAAAYSKYQSFKHPFSPIWISWYLREAFTAMLCANLPLTRPVLQHLFRTKFFTSTNNTSNPMHTSGMYGRYADGSRRSHTSTFQLRSAGNFTTIEGTGTRLGSRSGSEEHINYENGGGTSGNGATGPLEIFYEREIRVENDPRPGHAHRRKHDDDISDSDVDLEGGMELGKGGIVQRIAVGRVGVGDDEGLQRKSAMIKGPNGIVLTGWREGSEDSESENEEREQGKRRR
ncbi:hypothetical protein P154DRAFT_431761 [Amniculicola lignicola CBS 123094]|uniref:Rhodopsin domain-containing protein n=1 Tax=Amniculicola lignicola CBS 123094 TaxID=1392246 RepID=A0A6A5WK41_9PLEO|nr:hypothetical protein P154DRAFT_431761 [Amniculicola lignicola CBS 123094]